MTQEVIETGELPNDGSGDPLRLAFDKINNNFANLFTTLGANVELIDSSQFPEGSSSNNGSTQNILNIGQVVFNTNIISDSIPAEPQLLSFTTSEGPYGAQEYINIGATPNDGLGDPLRTAFSKINNNFSNLFFTTVNTSNVYTSGLTAGQVIYEYPANAFTQGSFQIRSSDPGTPDSQDITISAQLTNNNDAVKFTGYAMTFSGNSLTRYNMDVSSGNVRILANPIANTYILHFIASQVTFLGDPIPGVDISLNGYANSVMGTENDDILTTEN
jgi:hypothetical protein